MAHQRITTIQTIFSSRLDTLSHLLDVADRHFADDLADLLQRRIAPDMLPFGTQIAFTCNQPRNFALWGLGQSANNLNPEVTSLAVCCDHIATTQALLASINVTDVKLSEITRIDFGQGRYAELSGLAYVDDFLMPNFYFHLTIAYAIMRMAGAPIGKYDYMRHFVPFVKHQGDK